MVIGILHSQVYVIFCLLTSEYKFCFRCEKDSTFEFTLQIFVSVTHYEKWAIEFIFIHKIKKVPKWKWKEVVQRHTPSMFTIR